MTDTTQESVERECRNIHDAITRKMIPAVYGARWQDMLRALLTRAEAAEAALLATCQREAATILRWESRLEAADAERDALAAKLAQAVEALEECRQELDNYSQNEYPSDHPVHIRYRQRDYDANPARIALAQLTADTPKEGKDDE